MNEMRITRTIWPVGHGAFYTECLYPNNDRDHRVTIVYDCGAKKKEIILKEIDKYLDYLSSDGNCSKTIDCLVISHFHNDHVNGLQYILDNADVKYLILPQFSEKALVEAFVYNALNGENTKNDTECDIDSPAQELIYGVVHNGYSSLSKDTQIIEVQSNVEAVPQVVELYDKEKVHDLESIGSCTRLVVAQVPLSNTTNNNPRWMLVPINLEYPENNCYEFLKDLSLLAKKKEKSLPDIIDNDKVNWDNLKELLQNVPLFEVRKCYEKYYGTNNSYCMPMYSGWENPSFAHDKNIRRQNCYSLFHRRSFHLCLCKEFKKWDCAIEYIKWCTWSLFNDYRLCQCLYMGDFETKKHLDLLRNQLGPLWTEIGLQQIPHHASNNNHHPDFYKGAPYKACFGNIDKENDRSFSYDVLKSICSDECLPFLVTEADDALVFTSKLDC